jgi:hypothetical protein
VGRWQRFRAGTAIALAVVLMACGSGAGSETAVLGGVDDADTAPTTSIEQREDTVNEPEPTPDPISTDPVADAVQATDAVPTTDALPATDVPTTNVPAVARSTCRRLSDFAGDDSDWVIVNDAVMGGRSNGVVEFADSTMRFTGTVVTQGGGFTSVRYQLDGTELAGTRRIEMRVRSDGRTYGLTFEDASQLGGRSVSHRADLATDGPTDADGWQIVTMAYGELRPSIFGQTVDAAPFDPDQAREIGIIIADGTDGDFALDVDWIDACR